MPPSDSWAALNAEIMACTRCPRLVAWREEVACKKRRAYRDWDYWGKPVPGFGDRQARLLILGLAPGAHGANRTGRMFTGDSSGDTLFGSLHRTGFANQSTSDHRQDDLQLKDAFLTAVGRCVPPQNKPKASELNNCRPFFKRELSLLGKARVVVALGGLAFNGYLRALREEGLKFTKPKFSHGACFLAPQPWPVVIASYHPSQQNTSTGRLTEAMLDNVFTLARRLIEADTIPSDVDYEEIVS
ncbi:MAG: uracil-DNA glycosylase [Anaerolineales bacterium]